MRSVKVDFGGELKEFPQGVSILLYGSVASGKTTFSLTLAKEFIRNSLPCIWICLDESPVSVREKMAYFQLDYPGSQEKNLLRFIDLYSEQITGKAMADPYVINCSSAFNLNEINRALARAFSEVEGPGIVVFDSVSTLLLYNRSGTAEEFLKVHMSRITQSGFTGFFILQRDLHDSQTEETLKMMCDSVLEFGFDKDARKIEIIKLPLGSSGEWIESSLFAWQKAPGISISRPGGPRKYMDSGGYIEEFKEGLIEGLREGFTKEKAEDEGKGGGGAAGAAGSPGAGKKVSKEGEVGFDEGEDGSQPPAPGSGEGPGSGVAAPRGGHRFQAKAEGELSVEDAQRRNLQGESVASASSRGIVPIPTVQHIDKQIIVTDFSGIPDKLGDEIKDLLNEQLRLRDAMNEKESLTRESKKRLELLENKEAQAKYEVKEINAKNEEIRKALNAKKTALVALEAQKTAEEAKLKEAVKTQQAVKTKIDGILSRKKTLETKIHDLMQTPGELYIDLNPYLQDVITRLEAEVAKSRETLDSIDVRIAESSTAIKIFEGDLVEVSRHTEDKMAELEEVRSRKAKVEAELAAVSEARKETETKLKGIVDKKKQLEEKLKELMGGGK